MKDYDSKKIYLINYKAIYGENWDNYGTKEIGVYECKTNTIAYKISEDKYLDLIKGFSIPKSMINSVEPANIERDTVTLEDAINYYREYVLKTGIQNSEILMGKEYNPNCPLPKFFEYSPFDDRKKILDKIVSNRLYRIKMTQENERFIFSRVNSFVNKLSRTLVKY